MVTAQNAFFNFVKNKNAPFFEVFTSVNLKKVRLFFNICEESCPRENHKHMTIFILENFFLKYYKKTHLFQIYTRIHPKKRCVFIFLNIKKSHLFQTRNSSKILAIYAYILLNYNYHSLRLRNYMLRTKYNWKWKGAFFQYRKK